MIYNAYFEMATAVMLFILIIVYFWKKNLPVQSNRLYLNVLILLVIETCLSAAQCYYECRNDIMSSFAAYVVNSAAFTVGIIFIAMYNNYVLSLFHYKKKINAYCIISYFDSRYTYYNFRNTRKHFKDEHGSDYGSG